MSRNKRLPGDARIAEMHAAMLKKQQEQGRPMNITSVNLRSLTPEQMQQAVRDSLAVVNPPDNSGTLSTEMEGLIQLRITDVVPYDRNPRRYENERYNDIKESIREANVLAPIVVTRRPGEQQFMVAAGGNTRLRAQQELWAETGDPRFEYLLGIYRPWQSELTTMVAHVAENELRGGLNFWDRANAVRALKLELEAQPDAKPLSLRQLRAELSSRGLPSSIGLLSHYIFAVEELDKLGDVQLAKLTKVNVESLQPEFNRLRKYLQLHGKEECWPQLRDQALRLYAVQAAGIAIDSAASPGARPGIDPEELVIAIEREIQGELEQTPAEMERIVAALKKNPALTSLQDVLIHLQAQVQVQVEARNQLQTQEAGSLAMPQPPCPVPASEESADDPSRNSGAVSDKTDGAVPAQRQKNPPPLADIGGFSGAVYGEINAAAPFPAPGPDDAESSLPGLPQSSLTQTGAVASAGSGESAIVRFVRACGVADLYRECPGFAGGYFMELPATDQVLEHAGENAARWRHGGWWIAAMLSGQIGAGDVRMLPENSLWRQLHDNRDETENELALQWHIETVLGSPPGLAEVTQWLLACPQHLLDAYNDLVRDQRLKQK